MQKFQNITNAVDMEDPLWRQFTITVNDLFAPKIPYLQIRNYECD